MILFYVSGHGYGHATRTNAVIRALWNAQPNLTIHVRTMAPSFLFDSHVRHTQACIEPGVVEHGGSLGVDLQATGEAVREFLTSLDEIVAREADFVSEQQVELIAADIPFTAGAIARTAGVPSVAMGNFLWSWILAGSGVEDDIRSRYAQIDRALRYPLSHTEGWEVFPRVDDVGLVAPLSYRSRSEIRAELGLSDKDRVVLVGGRASLSAAGKKRLLQECREYSFIYNDSLPEYLDLARAADIVVSKPGYSTAAQCIAEGQVLLYPPRTGFPEDPMLLPQLHRFGRAMEIPLDAWTTGDWCNWLRQAMDLPKSSPKIALNGAENCAQIMLNMLT